ncbi:MAG TPA: aldo/keto reductase, partial [Gemmataceae bacterium]
MSDTPVREVSRRDFLKTTGAASAAALAGATWGDVFGDEAKLPLRVLGKTGVKVPVLGLGTASAGHRPRKEASEFYDRAISMGVTYMDTAPEFAGYGVAQVALGDVLKDRRKEVFLVTKCYEPDGEKALALLKQNLKELQTDHADVVYAHSIGADRMDLKTVMGPTGVMKALEKARADGLCRFVGISGHNKPAKFLEVLKEFDVQVMMNAVSFVSRHIYNFEEKVWPVAREKNVGLVA